MWVPPGAKHWHGATATNGMSHIAFSEALDGKTVEGWSRYRKSMTPALTAVPLSGRVMVGRPASHPVARGPPRPLQFIPLYPTLAKSANPLPIVVEAICSQSHDLPWVPGQRIQLQGRPAHQPRAPSRPAQSPSAVSSAWMRGAPCRCRAMPHGCTDLRDQRNLRRCPPKTVVAHRRHSSRSPGQTPSSLHMVAIG